VVIYDRRGWPIGDPQDLRSVGWLVAQPHA